MKYVFRNLNKVFHDYMMIIIIILIITLKDYQIILRMNKNKVISHFKTIWGFLVCLVNFRPGYFANGIKQNK